MTDLLGSAGNAFRPTIGKDLFSFVGLRSRERVLILLMRREPPIRGEGGPRKGKRQYGQILSRVAIIFKFSFSLTFT